MVESNIASRLGRYVETPVAGEIVRAFVPPALPPQPQIDVLPIQGINVYDILRREKLVLTRAAVDALQERFK